MKIAITGSSGFIGTHLKNRLLQKNIEIIEIDITNGIDLLNWQLLKQIDSFDYLIHLAGKLFVPDSYQQSFDFYNTNITGTLHALELCKQKAAKMIFFSSYVYGQPEYLPIDEKHPLKAFNPYADTKIKGEDLCYSYANYFNVPVVVFRPFNIYGEGQSSNFLISKIIQQTKNESKIILDDPRPRRDYINVSDVVDAVVKMIDQGFDGFDVFNLGTGISYSVAEVIDIVQEIVGNKFEFTGKQRKNEVLDTVANISKMNKKLNWIPQISLKEGLMKLL
ncbi:NAD-dependent epimerase/dehydratase family protein [Maribellus sediminis]|uniref:NAD-dependent epimerase/dehydratase family protein n=1 Tax=Maribellus sediminis TaxID=2696285 RepID=UPI00142F9BD6|nr:NAD(P)-dependent oxidoreductase [Maribellus sediminis]